MQSADGSDLGIEAGDRRAGLLTLDNHFGVSIGSGCVEGQNATCERPEHLGFGELTPSAPAR